MADEIKKEELMEEELSEEELDQIAGGAGLRRTVKVKTVDISEDIKNKII